MKGKKWMQRLLLALAALLYGLAVVFCQAAGKNAAFPCLVLSRSIDGARAEEIFAREQGLAESVGFCFWGEGTEQQVQCRETGGMAQVTPVYLSGNPELLDAGVLAWQAGCLLDAETAQRLFGTDRCGGQTLWRGDVPYRVLGTVPADKPTMVALAGEGDGLVLNRCVLAAPAEGGAQIADQFLMRWGLQGSLADYYPLWVLCHNLLLVLPGLLVLAALLQGARKLGGLLPSRRQLPGLLKPLLLLLGEAGLLVLLGSRILMQPDMLPTRWSDFSFWGSWAEAQGENFRLVLRTPMGNTHLQMMANMVKSMVCTTASGLLALMLMNRRRPDADSDD
ncbi:MAG: hypothetical protein Q4F17_05915 [Eubacteriales bacterium]|nr:hypothetical protein [Eubacteriales bacterium]